GELAHAGPRGDRSLPGGRRPVHARSGGEPKGMADEEQRLIEEAQKSQEETQEPREESGLGRDDEPDEPPDEDETPESPEDEPWGKTSSGDADEVTDDS